MVVQYKLIKDNKAIDAKFEKLRTIVDDFKKEFLQESALFVVAYSPVDTGTYMDNHNIVKGRGNVGRSFAETSSFNRPRGQPYQPWADAAIARMFSQIEALPEDSDNVTIVNNALHAPNVEYDHGHAVYTSLRNSASILAQKAALRAKAKL